MACRQGRIITRWSRRSTLRSVLISGLFLLVLQTLSTVAHATSGLWVVTNSLNSVALTERQIKTIFSLKQKSWPNGSPIQIVVLPQNDILHERFCLDTLDLFPYQLNRIWERQIYTGNAIAPIVARSRKQLLDYVLTHPNAIGYIDSEVSDDSITLFAID